MNLTGRLRGCGKGACQDKPDWTPLGPCPAVRGMMGRDFAWLDTGTQESLLKASAFIETIEKRQGLKVACMEKVAYPMGYIDGEQLRRLAAPMSKNGYGQYLLGVLEENR